MAGNVREELQTIRSDGVSPKDVANELKQLSSQAVTEVSDTKIESEPEEIHICNSMKANYDDGKRS